jgi:hypothetical protein
MGDGGPVSSAESTERQSDLDPDPDSSESERRFLLSRDEVVEFLAAIRPNAVSEIYDPLRPLAFARTTYFDTDDLSYLRSCDGPVARRLRVREYAQAVCLGDTPVLSGVSFLELKQNAGATRSKVRFSAPPAVIEWILEGRRGGALAGPALRDFVAELEQMSALAAIDRELAAAPVSPRLTTWYQRCGLTSERGRVRITLDQGLAFCRPQALGRGGDPAEPADVVAYGPERVLEVKHWGAAPDWLVRATLALAPAAHFSKFRIGMAALARNGGGVPAMVAEDGEAQPASAYSLVSDGG